MRTTPGQFTHLTGRYHGGVGPLARGLHSQVVAQLVEGDFELPAPDEIADDLGGDEVRCLPLLVFPTGNRPIHSVLFAHAMSHKQLVVLLHRHWRSASLLTF